MKHLSTFLIALLTFYIGTAQVNSGLNNFKIKAVNDKVMMSGDDALLHLLVNPNPNTAAISNAKSVNLNETVIGNTTYDLQTNAAIQDRIIMHNDGSISAAWTMSQQYNTTFADRGSGYNFYSYSNGAWDANPTMRLESSRCGWPSMIVTGNGKEAVITHNTDNSYVGITHRASIGSGAWTENIISSQDSTGMFRDMIWNRSAVGGLNNETIHMIAVTASSNFNGPLFNGLDGALVYYRSQDEGVTWDRMDVQLPSLDTSNFIGMSGDVYAIDARGETVVIAYFDDWGDSFILKSDDNGDNWTRTTFLDVPVQKYAMDDGFDLDGNDTTDHLFSTDNYGAVILDNNNMAHVAYGVMQYADDDLTDAQSSWYPGTNMLAYWNESFGADNYLDSTYSQYPSYTVNGNVVDTLHYSTDTVFTNQWDSATNTTVHVPTNYLQIIHYNDPNNPSNPTDTMWVWESNILTNVYDSIGNIDTTILLSADTTIYHSYNSTTTYFTVANNTQLQDTINFIDAAGIATPRGRWWSDMMDNNIIASAPDLNGDGLVDGIDSTGGYALYYASRASMPNIGLTSNNEIWLSFAAYQENADNGTQVYRHIYLTKSSDGGITWKEPVDVTPSDVWNGMLECVYGSMHHVVDDKVRLIYQRDFEPGLAVRGDEDIPDNNDIVYLEIDTVGLWSNTPTSINEIKDNFSLNLYPNPAINSTTLEVYSDNNSDIEINIIDVLGKNVFSEKTKVYFGKNIKTLDVSNLQQGVYFINTSINNNIISKKLTVK